MHQIGFIFTKDRGEHSQEILEANPKKIGEGLEKPKKNEGIFHPKETSSKISKSSRYLPRIGVWTPLKGRTSRGVCRSKHLLKK